MLERLQEGCEQSARQIASQVDTQAEMKMKLKCDGFGVAMTLLSVSAIREKEKHRTNISRVLYDRWSI